jgi:SRSO17 transposase
MTKIYKSKSKLKVEDKYKTKTEIAREMVKELNKLGFKIELVLADSLYGESSSFLKVLEKLKLEYVVSIRNNHGVWMPSNKRVRANKWYKLTRTFSDGKTETRYIREIIYGKKRKITYKGNDHRYGKFTEKCNQFCDDKLSGKFEKKIRRFIWSKDMVRIWI